MVKESTVLAYQLSLVEAQQSQLRARYFEQRVAGGDYRSLLGKVSHGFDVALLTEAELRASELATMHRHINMAEDHLEHAKELLAEIRSQE